MSDLVLNEESTEQVTEEAVVEFMTSAEYITAAYYAYDIASDIDTTLLNKSDERRVRRIRRQSLRIIAECLNDLYNEIFEDENDADE